MEPRQLGPYKVLSLLGAGGMGEVYRARDPRLGREVAIKVMPPQLAQDPEALARFTREAKIVAALSHPNILAIHDVGTEQGVSYAVMELLSGETLRVRLNRGTLPWRKAVEIGIALADGLAAAHDKDITHRDLKPENIFLTADGQIKILDFGIARISQTLTTRATEAGTTLPGSTAPGSVIGTVGYMSPEQLRGEEVDASSDIFSFGCVIYEAVAGRRAFARPTAAETTAAILMDDPPDLAETGATIPREVTELIRHCLEKNPKERFQSARDLSYALKAVLSNAAASTSVGAHASRRLEWVPWAGAALLALAAIVWWQPWRRSLSPPSPQQRLISSFPGSHGEASFSPDGSLIAFINDAGGVPQVWIKNLAEGAPIQITNGTLPAHRPRWSPKSDQIVFSSGGSIWSVPPLGGPQTRLIEGSRNPGWSWDGSRLVFEKNDEIWTARADGSDQRKVEGVPTPEILLADRTPAFSPDGTRLAFFQCSKGPIGDIWVIPSTGGQPRQLTFDDYLGGTPVWTPDGRFIVFSSQRSGSRTLWRIAASGGGPEPVLVSAGEDTDPELTRNGRQIIYTNTRNSYVLTLWNPSTGQTRELVDARYALTDPSFSPRGDKLAFFAEENDADIQVHTIDLDGGNHVQATRGKGERNIHPRWSPDGMWLYFYQIRPTFSFRRISVSGGPSSEIAAGWTWGTHNAAQVDPQGKWIAYVKQEKGGPATTMLREMATGQERIFKTSFRDPQWSQDGKVLLGTELVADHATTIREISTCSVETGDCRRLTQGRLYPRWSRDGSRIYFFRDSKPGEGRELWSMSAAGADEKSLGALRVHPIGAFYDVSPQGEIVYVRFSPGKSELWLADVPRY